MNNKKKKRRIKKQLIFNLISIFIIGIFGTYYLGRLIYYKKEYKNERKEKAKGAFAEIFALLQAPYSRNDKRPFLRRSYYGVRACSPNDSPRNNRRCHQRYCQFDS